MLTADLTTRAVAGLVDLLLVIGLARLPDVFGFLSAAGYILIRDGLFNHQSIGKKLIGLLVVSAEDPDSSVSYRESIIRNAPFVVAFFLFLIPYVGWIFSLFVVSVECLTALGDSSRMRIGDMLAKTYVVLQASGPGKPKNAPEQSPNSSRSDAIEPCDSQQ